MKVLKVSIILLCLTITSSFGQTKSSKAKLVVGIVVDQMRFDQLYKYESKFSEDGFKRLLKQGFNYKNAHVNYIPTVTAAGHASLYTGATPSVHGIVGNNWFDRVTGKEIGNSKDAEHSIVGSKVENKRGISPKNLWTATISDQIRMASNFKSKVISISLKDRGAVLPGGTSANAAYWHDWQTSPGYFVSSSYYMKTLPTWVSNFNQKEKSSKYLDTIWNTLYPIETYTESSADDNPYERTLMGKEAPVFPYNFKELRKTYRELKAEYQLLWISPGGNTLLTEFAKEAIKHEKLGNDTHTDLINISYSVPDVIGHTYGIQSKELEDIYIRLDRDIASLLKYLDTKVGKDNYVLFLSSDHAATPVASYLHDHQLPTGIANIHTYKTVLEQFLNETYGTQKWISFFDGEQVYLDRKLIANNKLELKVVQEKAAQFLKQQDGISEAVSGYDMETESYATGIKQLLQNGFHPKRSGDVLLVFKPGYVETTNPKFTMADAKGSMHGSGYTSDTHIPIVWFGKGIPHGSSTRKVAITDIAPSLALLLDLQLPNGVNGFPLYELFKS